MAGICEAGHRSHTDDYCDVCGLPVRPAPAATPAPPQNGRPTSQACPNCGSANPADALFCEACGYDYTTGTLPRSDVAGMLGLRPREQEKPVSQPPDTYQHATNPRDPEEPVDDLAPVTAGDGAAEIEPPAEAEQIDWPDAHDVPASDDQVSPLAPPDGLAPADVPPVGVADVSTPAGPQPEAPSNGTGGAPASTDRAPEGAPVAPVAGGGLADAEGTAEDAPTSGRPAPRRESYVAEVWIDPDWFAVQQSPDTMPSVGLPTTATLSEDNLIGRVSKSRDIFPEVDCGTDSGCSRSQARLISDGTRWYVEDLQSANGTYVAPASGPLPTTPIAGRTELGPDDRIYVGAWTRIVVRKASKEEMDALG